MIEQNERRKAEQSKNKLTEQPPDFKFTVVLPAPKTHALMMMPPKECKVVREFSPREKHLLDIYEKKERLKALKGRQELSMTARNSKVEIKKHTIDEKVEQLLDTQLDKLIRPEAANQGQLDLNKNELHVKNNFSVERAKQLN